MISASEDKLLYDHSETMDIAFGEWYRRNKNSNAVITPTSIRSDPRLEKLIKVILAEAIEVEATDIQITNRESYGLVRFRVGTKMVDHRKIHKDAMYGLGVVLRSMSDVNIEEINKAQINGRFAYDHGRSRYDVRAAFIPSIGGQTISLRVLYSNRLGGNIDKLGFPDQVSKTLKEVLSLKEGLIFLTGGTSSGKTTTLYTSIRHIINKTGATKNIMTIENPIEYQIDGVEQSQTNDILGYDFAVALQALLRMDPDVILVGEVNDEGTARAAVRAASSGHLVLSTLHTSDTVSVNQVLRYYGISRLDMGNSLQLVINQTLEEKLCPHCRKPRAVTSSELNWMTKRLKTNEQIVTVYEKNPVGCSECQGYGIKGLVLVVEMLDANHVYKKALDDSQEDLDKLKEMLMTREFANFYPKEWDVFRHLQKGNIDMATAKKILR